MKEPAAKGRHIPRNLPRGRHGLSRELVQASQRMRLLDAIAELTAEKGYAAVTIADIVTRGGVAKRTFYEYFEDKEACFLAAGEHLADQIVRTITLPHDPGLDLYRRAEATIRGLLQLLAERPSYARAFVVEVWAAGPRAINMRLEVDRQLALLLVALSRDVSFHQSGARPVSELHAVAVIEAVGGILYRIVFSEGAGHLTRQVETLAQLATGLLLAEMPQPGRQSRRAAAQAPAAARSRR
ncbi:MAG: helix-turn-helix domain containing protein [Nevskia sp.]|nr:helix-turn-helix domain containing protein [Nevskia sp.]